MGRLVRILLLGVAGFVGLAVIAAVALSLFFDPNDFRDEISTQVKAATGRDLVIEGDLSLSVFPWIAVNIGRTQLGNAEGFGDEPFLSFEEARLSVRLAPLLFQQTVTWPRRARLHPSPKLPKPPIPVALRHWMLPKSDSVTLRSPSAMPRRARVTPSPDSH